MKRRDAPVSTSALIVALAVIASANMSPLGLFVFFVLMELRIRNEPSCISSCSSSWALTSAASLPNGRVYKPHIGQSRGHARSTLRKSNLSCNPCRSSPASPLQGQLVACLHLGNETCCDCPQQCLCS